VTLTDPEVRRYFMTIPEAVQLVLQAAVMGRGGEVFALDMGSPIRIADLAQDMIRLSGLEPGRDIDVVYTGLRPGEKLYEEVFFSGDDVRATSHPKILVAEVGGTPVGLFDRIDEMAEAVAAAAPPTVIRRMLRELVPEYVPPEERTDAIPDQPAALLPLPVESTT
jgi:FlaA1/EpsC-like NDP-sugar epimerase